MRQFKYKGFRFTIQRAPFPFAQFVDIYGASDTYWQIHDQDSRSSWELKEWAKQSIDRHLRIIR